MPPGSGAGRNQSAREAMTRRLLQAAVQLAYATHLARQSQLTDHDHAVRQGLVDRVAADRKGETEVRGRLADANAARHVDEYIRVTQRQFGALGQDADEHVQSVEVEAIGDPARGVVGADL